MMKQRYPLLFPLILLLLLLGTLVLMSNATQNSAEFDALYSILLLFNLLGLLTFIVLISLNIRRLVRQLKDKTPGARLTLRMVKIFTVMSVIPVLIVYGFSMDFISRGIDSWFDLRIEQALDDSLELSRSSLNMRMTDLLKQTEMMAEELLQPSNAIKPLNLSKLLESSNIEVSNSFSAFNLDKIRSTSGTEELAIFTLTGNLIASSSSNTNIIPNPPEETVLLQLRQGGSYIALEPLPKAGMVIRVVVEVPQIGIQTESRILQALYPMASGINELAKSVEAAYIKYRELSYLRDQLKISFTMSLTLVLLYTIFTAVWAAFYTARRMTAPIRDLVEGTEAVARGNYETQLEVSSQDDLGLLVNSFNDMTRRIARARDEAKQSRDEVDLQRSYLEAVLGRLSSGVMAISKEGFITTSNERVNRILGITLSSGSVESLLSISEEHPHLKPFCDSIAYYLSRPEEDWQDQVNLFGATGHQVLMCRGTALLVHGREDAGHVIVFDDITALVKGQKDAAWSEVARRLAHEIKNPLTPIQLSAERLRQKYLGKMAPEDADILDRLTNTIIQQVDTMKIMVNTFSEYARSPQTQLKPTDLNRLVYEVIDLFQSEIDTHIETDLDVDLPEINADAARLRQVLNNLIRNALEAQHKGESWLRLSSRKIEKAHTPYIELRIEDAGEGVEESKLASIFEPYISNKPKGTGLGLAIVKKIIEEHSGTVWLENRAEGGACAVIRLPLKVSAQSTRHELRETL